MLSVVKKAAVIQRRHSSGFRNLLVFAFALLIGNAAAGLASGLAGSLAFAATALACAKLTGLESFDMFHVVVPP